MFNFTLLGHNNTIMFILYLYLKTKIGTNEL